MVAVRVPTMVLAGRFDDRPAAVAQTAPDITLPPGDAVSRQSNLRGQQGQLSELPQGRRDRFAVWSGSERDRFAASRRWCRRTRRRRCRARGGMPWRRGATRWRSGDCPCVGRAWRSSCQSGRPGPDSAATGAIDSGSQRRGFRAEPLRPSEDERRKDDLGQASQPGHVRLSDLRLHGKARQRFQRKTCAR